MKKGETKYIDDGVYIHFDGYGFELRANDKDHPTDRVYLEPAVAVWLELILREALHKNPDLYEKSSVRTKSLI